MSYAENEVATFLKKNHIRWEFQHPVSVKDPDDLTRIWYPDFYLPDLGLYVEVCGAEREGYERRKTTFEKNRIPIVFVQTYKDENTWKNYLLMTIKKIHESRWGKVKDLP
jgi:hypothetical protein